MTTAVKARMDCVRLTVTWGLPAPVFDTDGECPDRYKFPICTVVLCFPGALLSLSILYCQNTGSNIYYLLTCLPQINIQLDRAQCNYFSCYEEKV